LKYKAKTSKFNESGGVGKTTLESACDETLKILQQPTEKTTQLGPSKVEKNAQLEEEAYKVPKRRKYALIASPTHLEKKRSIEECNECRSNCY